MIGMDPSQRLSLDGIGYGANAVNLALDHITSLPSISGEYSRMSADRQIGSEHSQLSTLSHSGGLRKHPTPGGVPVRMRSPGVNVTSCTCRTETNGRCSITLEIHSISWPVLKTSWARERKWKEYGAAAPDPYSSPAPVRRSGGSGCPAATYCAITITC